MDKSSCFVGQIVHFTCNSRGRDGHFSVSAEVTKVNSKNALLTEVKDSYSPGTRWNWPIADLLTDEQDKALYDKLIKMVKAVYPSLIEGIQK